MRVTILNFYIDYGNTGCHFSSGGVAKQERFLARYKHTKMKLLNFENWCSGELLKIRHHYSNKVIKKCQRRKICF